MLRRILMVNEFFSYGDGSSLYLIKLSEALISLGFEVEVLYGTKREREYTHPAIKTYFVPDIFGFNYVNSNKGLRRIKDIVLTSQPDIIYIHQVLNPHVIFLLAEISPTVRYEHGFRLSCPTGRRMRKATGDICRYPFSLNCIFRAHIQRCMPRNPILAIKRILDVSKNIAVHKKLKKIIVPSRYVKDLVIQSGFSPDFISIIPYFVDIPQTSLYPSTEKKPCILFVGRIEYEKGPDFVLKALPKISIPTETIIIGEGTRLEKLKEMISDITGHEIIFTGWVDNDSLRHYYSKASLLLVTSIYPEPFGIIGIEAMSFGVPVVAFDVGGISDWLIDGETGFLVEREDVSGLVEKIELLFKDRDLAYKMGLKGREWVEKRFTKEIHIKDLMKVFHDALNE